MSSARPASHFCARLGALLILPLCSLVLPCSAQEQGLMTLKASPFLSVPLAESADLYTIGGGVALEGDYVLKKIPFLFTRLSLAYSR